MKLWDVHCHILPGVDDGSKDLETSMAMIEKEYEEGVRNIILTPHMRKKMFHPSDEAVVNGYEKLKKAVAKKYKDMNLYLGCELHVHSGMIEQLEEESAWKKTMIGTEYVLIEFSDGDALSRIQSYVKRVVNAGYKPILAHIERYSALVGHDKAIEEMRDIGAKMQINADSIIGKDGFWVKRRVRKWLKAGYVSFIGSDGHNMDSRVPDMGKAADAVVKLIGEDRAAHIMMRNPARILKSLDEKSDFE